MVQIAQNLSPIQGKIINSENRPATLLGEEREKRTPKEVTVVTYEELRKALNAVLGSKGMGRSEVKEVTEYLLGFFGYGTEVIDNVLQPEDRDVFYMLEEEGLLGTRQEEVLIARGKMWRIHYWVLKVDRMREALAEMKEQGEDYQALYDNISEEAWARH